MKKLLAVVIAASAVVGVIAHEKDAIPTFKELDVDQDGKISATEATVNEQFASLFNKLDCDRDGGISAAEYADLVKSQTM